MSPAQLWSSPCNPSAVQRFRLPDKLRVVSFGHSFKNRPGDSQLKRKRLVQLHQLTQKQTSEAAKTPK